VEVATPGSDDRINIGDGVPLETPACPICGGPTRVHLAGQYDDRFGYPGLFTVLGCRRCGHRHLLASFTPAELGRLYTDFYPRSILDIESFRPYTEMHGFRCWLAGERASAFRSVPRNVRVLDVGCGFGEALAYHQARGCEAYGIEADENILRVGERYGLNVKVGLFDPALYEPNYFDYVTAHQVVEHVANPREFLQGIATVLKPGGVAILTTPNGRSAGVRVFGGRWIHWHVPYHLQHFSRKSLGKLARESGFEVQSLKTVTNSAWLHYQYLHLVSAPPVGVASPFWDASRSPLRMPRRVVRVGRWLERAKLFDVITRAADAFGVGDNILCILRKPE
jgi:2-polyprenyl-3-methyl-5-hydroxy-6-metoxy-1,4-benzoquinol methylase